MFCCGEIGAPRWRIRPPEDEAEEPVLPDLLPPHGAYVSFVESDVIFFIIRGAFKNPRWNRPHSLGFRIHFSLKYAPDLLIYQSEAKKGSCKDSREHESTRLGGGEVVSRIQENPCRIPVYPGTPVEPRGID